MSVTWVLITVTAMLHALTCPMVFAVSAIQASSGMEGIANVSLP